MSRLANYSTEVAAAKSALEIQDMLRVRNAKSVLIDYINGMPSRISFLIPTKHGDISFRLPANAEKVKVILHRERVRPISSWDTGAQERLNTRAANVAWRIVRDWVRAQLSIIETEQVTLEQVFLPYMEVNGKQTLYEAMENKHFMLTQGSQEAES